MSILALTLIEMKCLAHTTDVSDFYFYKITLISQLKIDYGGEGRTEQKCHLGVAHDGDKDQGVDVVKKGQ